ncbi:hypothetical protein EVG20_g2839 [Dentipellis fragilis]|uniref:PUB domain-containing protein n=1 Tax=Dentipellis fragilis TaxID=205917 RepID=A0A4Y9Z5L5_9AGAM|nr:hypothetical protein EVG20_g2839 [Dentipellis fragilis]
MQNTTDTEPLSQSPPRSPSPTSAREARLAAIQNRLAQEHTEAAISGPSNYIPFDADHEKRQEFRRLIDPGILRVNRREQALASLQVKSMLPDVLQWDIHPFPVRLQTLLTIAENIIREPHNSKFKQFKPTNSRIKRDLVDPKGTLEYAVALGFRDEVIVYDFQPLYVFKDKHMPDLLIGAAILKEVMHTEAEKQEREERRAKLQKEEEQARVEKVTFIVKSINATAELYSTLAGQESLHG